jgi:hypothetical protein
MKNAFLLLLVAGCAARSATTATSATPTTPAAIADATVIARSHMR